MTRSKFLVITLLVLAAAAGWANGEQEAVEPTEVADGFKRIDAEDLRFDWRIDGDTLEVVLSAETTGWVSIGFEPSRVMQDANIIIGYVDGDEVVIEDHYGNALTAHRPDVDLGGESHVTILGGSESEGRTEIHFTIPLDSGDEFDQPLTAGGSHYLIYAFGADGQDNTRQKHQARGGFATTL